MNDIRAGTILILLFLITVSLTSIFIPTQIDKTGYQRVHSAYQMANPDEYEGCKVSIAIYVAEIDNQTLAEGQLLESLEPLSVRIPYSIGNISAGDYLNVRGISYLSSLGYVEATEVYVRDYPFPGVSRSLFHSIPGILAFIVLFFAVFRFNPTSLRFTPRRD